MTATPQRKPGQHALEKANPDRVRFQRGKTVERKGARRRRKR